MNAISFPFTAIVGQETLKTALCLVAVNPSIGGVLIRGERGTAKSTAARALASLLPPIRVLAGCPFNCDPDAPWSGCPHCGSQTERSIIDAPVPFVDLPLGATEDRVLGTLDFERALREARRSFQPGLLASAHRGILYIDEVNLLPDHLVDVLLDSAALGVNTVQREGVSVTHPARFMLIGTMNPEEGDLRPQLLDRFGLMVEVVGPREPELRVEVVRRRLGFETNPVEFSAAWTNAQHNSRQRILAARSLVGDVFVSEELWQLISRICCDLEVDGLRADIVMHKTAVARAAFEGRTEVTMDDVRAAAELVLPHRRRRRPFEQPGLDRDKLEELLSSSRAQPETREDSSQDKNGPEQKEISAERTFGAALPEKVKRLQLATDYRTMSAPGRRNRDIGTAQGHYRRAVPDGKPTSLAVDATVRAAARRGSVHDGALRIEKCDWHAKERIGTTGTRILFVVDASGSMAARRRMELVKGSVLRLLEDAYRQRDEAAVIVFRGPEACLLLPFTSAVEVAERALRELPTGGRTPLAHALLLAAELARSSKDTPPLLVILSDGKANVSLPGTNSDPWAQALEAAKGIAGVPALVVDSETGFIRSGRARELAAAMAAEYLPLDDLSADDLVLKVRSGCVS